MQEEQIIKIFCEVDDYVAGIKINPEQPLLESDQRQRRRETKLTTSEIAAIVILFHQLSTRIQTEGSLTHRAHLF